MKIDLDYNKAISGATITLNNAEVLRLCNELQKAKVAIEIASFPNTSFFSLNELTRAVESIAGDINDYTIRNAR